MISRITLAIAFMAMSTIVVGQDPQSSADVQEASQAAPASNSAEETTKPQVEAATETAQVDAVQLDAATNTEGDETALLTRPEPQQADAVADAAANTGTGGTDAGKLKELLSLVQDNTLAIHKRENPAYFLLVKDVLDRTTEQLRDAVTLNPRFNELYRKPSEYRGQLVHVKLNARRVLPVDIASRNAAGVTRLYEIWGWTEEAKAWMYCCVVPELPEGFPEEGDIAKRIELTGYFFKMQAYQPGNAAPNARALVAPLIIGRIVDAGPVQPKVSSAASNWPLFMMIGFGIIVMFRVMMHLRGLGRTTPVRRNYRRRSLEPVDPDALDDAIASTAGRGVRIRNANEV